jgi:2-dehydro-3-deoxyphosphogluconate aldolase/(4S)-4-hydroxy-2-oxoglutarate aldolase
MSQYTRIQVVIALHQGGLLPLFYHPDPETGIKILDACYTGGIRIMEFTNRGDFAHEVFARLNRHAIEKLPGMILGAGSVIDAPTAALYMQLGANFIVSPLLNEAIAPVCNRRKVLWIPGCGSVSEISRAEELGAEIVKIFPADQVGGPKFIQSVLGPMPWSSLMPTGGVDTTEQNLREWFHAGAFCVGMGSKLISNEIIKNNKFELLTQDVQEVLALISNLRKQINFAL